MRENRLSRGGGLVRNCGYRKGGIAPTMSFSSNEKGAQRLGQRERVRSPEVATSGAGFGDGANPQELKAVEPFDSTAFRFQAATIGGKLAAALFS